MRSPILSTVAVAALIAVPAYAASDKAEMTDVDQRAVMQCQEDVDAYISDNQDSLAATGTQMMRQDLRTLREAAMTFARSGDPEACQMVLDQMHELVERRAAQREDAAVTTADVQEKIDEAVQRQRAMERYQASPPVDQLKRSLAASEIIDADVIGLDQESLGTVEDVILDSDQKTVSYVLISHGGFLGMGQAVTPVRMDSLHVALLEDSSELTFLLPVTSEQMEKAPTVERDEQGYPVVSEWGQDVQAWWNEHIAS